MAVITSNDYFTLDGVSSATVGLYVDTPPVPPMAKQRYTTWQTALDADGSTPDDVFDNIQIGFNCYYFFRESFDLSPLYAFLQGKTALQFSRMPDRFFVVKQLAGITPVQQYDGNRIKMTIVFVCDPFKYHTANSAVTPTNNAVYNPGTRFSRPVYNITKTAANAAATLTVNGQTLQILSESPQKVTVDAARMIAYNTDTHANCTRFTSGLFPFLAPLVINPVTVQNCAVSIVGNWRDF